MKNHTRISHDSEHLVFKVPGTRGYVSRSALANALTIYRAELKALEDCHITVCPPHDEPSVVFSKCLVGEAVLNIPQQQEMSQNPDIALIKRVDQIKTTYSLQKGETIRYAAVMLPARFLAEQIGQNVPSFLDPLVSTRHNICHVHVAPSNRKIHNLAMQLFTAKTTNPAQNLLANGLASLFIAEIFAILYGKDQTKPDAEREWETHVFADLKAFIDCNLGSPLSRALLATKFDISESNLNRLFVKHTDQSYGDYVREKRMEAAHLALKDTTMSVSQIAQSVGYNHLSNFSRAYRKRYGEIPSRAVQRSRS
ncbi:AraC family transcriptional regulator [Thalassospira sp.]|uniref:helix-turn-helix transcriptional regulator n=1 Tax=Thalassospira sp. TaxID=1912094 RepID=UPI000C502B34|nr:AraC family transcriptional regulator [Thalassospira sp.]MBC05445.1 hypothetical protein [Thalassospira sp.]|tara:strand:+ start:606 stop:1538 length:933 start_codon:yes stop_codon:yes gene_type:complete